ncbi:MAG: 30S ribosomal protein S18 [Patescibacteria group bacterium]
MDNQCYFCKNHIDYVDFTNVDFLKNFVGNSGKMFSRKRTKNCVKHQNKVAQAVKRARFLALLYYVKR